MRPGRDKNSARRARGALRWSSVLLQVRWQNIAHHEWQHCGFPLPSSNFLHARLLSKGFFFIMLKNAAPGFWPIVSLRFKGTQLISDHLGFSEVIWTRIKNRIVLTGPASKSTYDSCRWYFQHKTPVNVHLCCNQASHLDAHGNPTAKGIKIYIYLKHNNKIIKIIIIMN